jgi:hypothetical protein
LNSYRERVVYNATFDNHVIREYYSFEQIANVNRIVLSATKLLTYVDEAIKIVDETLKNEK